MKIPFLVRLQCLKCGLRKWCGIWIKGMPPPIWTRTLHFITVCGSFKHEKDIIGDKNE